MAIVLVAGGLQASGRAQQPAQQPAQPTFRVSQRLIVTTAVVRDRETGRAIEGLTAKDFIVTEDNQPQDIAFVDFQQLEDQAPLPPLSSATLADALPPPPAPSDVPAVVNATITPPPPGDERFKNRRLIILYFDLSATPPPDQIRSYDAALKYLDSQMTPADLVAIMTYGGGAVRVKQDFTADRAKLREVIYVLVYGEDKDGDGERDPEDPSTAFGQNDAEFNIFNTDRQLSALQTAVRMLRPFPEQKSLVFFASNLRLNGTDNNAQLRATTNAAIQANTLIFPVDARGLVASAPLGDANQRSPGGIGMFTGALAQRAMNTFQRSQDTLYALAKDTGGKAMFDFNDLSLGIKQAADAQTSYYIIGFYSTHIANDGKYRRVQVRLANPEMQARAELNFRPGYFADKEWAKQSTADRERQLEEAMMLENPITDVPIALELNYFQLNSAEYFIPVAVKIPGSELELARRRGAKRLLLDVIVEVKDDYGSTQQNIRDKIESDVSQVNAELLGTRPIQYETGFTLLPGKYVMKFLVRDAEAGRVGTFQTNFTIPNLNREQQKLPISSVVLASQRQQMSDALFSVRTTDKNNVGNPLIIGGEKLLPSVTRVFSAQRDLYIYLQAYERNTTEAQDPVLAFATFYKDGVKAFETQPVAVTDGMHPRSKAVSIRMSIPLQGLPPGRYDCQVTVLEPAGQKVAFWQAPIAIVP